MKYLFVLVLTLVPVALLGQVYSKYSCEGTSKSTIGPVQYRIVLTLNDEHEAFWKILTYDHQNESKYLVKSDSVTGTWHVEDGILTLDFNPLTSEEATKRHHYKIIGRNLKQVSGLKVKLRAEPKSAMLNSSG